MINIYRLNGNLVDKSKWQSETVFDSKVLWLDIINPSNKEKSVVEEGFKVDIPSHEEIEEIEVSNCLYHENGAYYLTATMVSKPESGEYTTGAVTFILTGKVMLTVRYFDTQSFRSFSNKILKFNVESINAESLFVNLFEESINRTADILEKVGRDIDKKTKKLFTPNNIKNDGAKVDYKEILRGIGASGDLIAKSRESLVSFNRLLAYVVKSGFVLHSKNLDTEFEGLIKDVVALSDHANFLSNKISFLLDATLGMINIEQNAIIKIFSVAAVIFLPPTLIASIYGMNFEYMPELKAKYGYVFAVILMGISAFAPWRFFKKRGWL